jgi:hypothetical protein
MHFVEIAVQRWKVGDVWLLLVEVGKSSSSMDHFSIFIHRLNDLNLCYLILSYLPPRECVEEEMCISSMCGDLCKLHAVVVLVGLIFCIFYLLCLSHTLSPLFSSL